MGEHTRESDADPGPGRLGIGNLPGHPSNSIEGLCGEGGQNCPGAIDDYLPITFFSFVNKRSICC